MASSRNSKSCQEVGTAAVDGVVVYIFTMLMMDVLAVVTYPARKCVQGIQDYVTEFRIFSNLHTSEWDFKGANPPHSTLLWFDDEAEGICSTLYFPKLPKLNNDTTAAQVLFRG